MKQYIIEFLKEFDYSNESSKILVENYDKITENEEANAIWESAIEMYNKSINCDYNEIIAKSDKVAEMLYLNEYTLNLLVFICLSKRMREVYKERGIDDEIYKNTVLDLKYKMLECEAIKGVCGTFVVAWFPGFFNLTRFALGRLQFEIIEFGYSFEKDGKKLIPESKVINVHIPRTLTPLDEKSCDEAFLMAKEFFKEEVGKPLAFACHSWLLYPENEKILSEKSNTYKFMKRFNIVSSGIDKDNNDLWRLFDTDERDYRKLPADSGFRRAYVEHLKNGGKTGWGQGVFFVD